MTCRNGMNAAESGEWPGWTVVSVVRPAALEGGFGEERRDPPCGPGANDDVPQEVDMREQERFESVTGEISMLQAWRASCRNQARARHSDVPTGEPSLKDVLSDPIVRMMMRRDGVTRRDISKLVEAIGRASR